MSKKALKPITEPSLLFGRERLLNELLGSKNNHAILGEPKQGKTSLVRCLASRLEREKRAYILLDQNYSSKIDDITSNLLSFLDKKIDDQCVYILIDDFDQIFGDNALLHPLRSIGELKNVMYVITSRKRINESTYLSCSPFYNIFMYHQLRNLDLDATQRLVASVEENIDTDADNDDDDNDDNDDNDNDNDTAAPSEAHSNIEQIHQLTGGHPYLVKLYLNYPDPLQDHDFWLTLENFFMYCWAHLRPDEQSALLERNLLNPALQYKGYIFDYGLPKLLEQWLTVNETTLRELFDEQRQSEYWSAFMRGIEFCKKQMDKLDGISPDIFDLLS